MHKEKPKRVIQGQTGYVGKVAVMGLLSRHGNGQQSQATTRVLNAGMKRKATHDQIAADVEPGSNVGVEERV